MRTVFWRWMPMAAALASLTSVWAHWNGPSNWSLQGQVTAENTPTFDGLSVDLQGTQQPTQTHATLDASGTFRFDGLQQGSYRVTVVDLRGTVIAREVVTLNGPTTYLTLPLHRAPASENKGGMISAQALAHKPMKSALRAYNDSERARNKGDIEGWQTKLRDAVRLDPAFAEAQHQLGVYFLATRRLDDAVQQFTTFLALDPSSASGHRNIGMALLGLSRWDEAAMHLRKAFQLDPISARGRFLLGVADIQTKNRAEGLDLLRGVQNEVPEAKTLLAKLEGSAK